MAGQRPTERPAETPRTLSSERDDHAERDRTLRDRADAFSIHVPDEQGPDEDVDWTGIRKSTGLKLVRDAEKQRVNAAGQQQWNPDAHQERSHGQEDADIDQARKCPNCGTVLPQEGACPVCIAENRPDVAAVSSVNYRHGGEKFIAVVDAITTSEGARSLLQEGAQPEVASLKYQAPIVNEQKLRDVRQGTKPD
ncbi:MAG: hypothetical protein AB1758_28025 [Candidatus Eremiobacterota bacterium]